MSISFQSTDVKALLGKLENSGLLKSETGTLNMAGLEKCIREVKGDDVKEISFDKLLEAVVRAYNNMKVSDVKENKEGMSALGRALLAHGGGALSFTDRLVLNRSRLRFGSGNELLTFCQYWKTFWNQVSYSLQSSREKMDTGARRAFMNDLSKAESLADVLSAKLEKAQSKNEFDQDITLCKKLLSTVEENVKSHANVQLFKQLGEELPEAKKKLEKFEADLIQKFAETTTTTTTTIKKPPTETTTTTTTTTTVTSPVATPAGETPSDKVSVQEPKVDDLETAIEKYDPSKSQELVKIESSQQDRSKLEVKMPGGVSYIINLNELAPAPSGSTRVIDLVNLLGMYRGSRQEDIRALAEKFVEKDVQVDLPKDVERKAIEAAPADLAQVKKSEVGTALENFKANDASYQKVMKWIDDLSNIAQPIATALGTTWRKNQEGLSKVEESLQDALATAVYGQKEKIPANFDKKRALDEFKNFVLKVSTMGVQNIKGEFGIQKQMGRFKTKCVNIASVLGWIEQGPLK